MVANQTENGFTVVEVVVTLVVMAVFVTLFFQTYLTNVTQQKAVIARSAADDIAVTNLKKITTRNSTLISGNSITCGSANDLTATPAGTGSVIDLHTYASGTYEESLSGTDLAAYPATKQTLTILYPQGCNPPATVPIEVISTVNYNSGGESVQHATYIN